MIDYSKIRQMIDEADAILIGAGAGLSASAGISYGRDEFQKEFPELVEKYQMTDMYSSSFYHFQTEEEKWSYWAKHIDSIYNHPVTSCYQNLFNLCKDKNYFVITTNVDGQFLKAGFDPNKVFEIQGTLSKIQCSVACHNQLYDDLDLVKKMQKKELNCKVPPELVPYCPNCGKTMEVNLRKDQYFVEDTHWHQLNQNYEHFLEENRNKKLLCIELGVGFNTPSIIRFPFEQMANDFSHTTLLRINEKDAHFLFDIPEKVIYIQEDCAEFLEKLCKN